VQKLVAENAKKYRDSFQSPYRGNFPTAVEKEAESKLEARPAKKVSGLEMHNLVETILSQMKSQDNPTKVSEISQTSCFPPQGDLVAIPSALA
jgi:hypothetical protein